MIDRAIRTTAIISLVLEIVFTLLGRFAFPIMIFYSSGYPGKSLQGGYSDGITYYISRNFIGSFLLLTAFIIFAVLLISTSKSNNEKIGMEIAAMAVTGIGLPVLNMIVSTLSTYAITARLSIEAIAANNVLGQAASYFGIINSAAILLLFISCTISICRKKYVIPLEYERGIGVNEEYNTADPGSYYE